MKLYASLVLSACFIQVYSLPQKTDKRYSVEEFGRFAGGAPAVIPNDRKGVREGKYEMPDFVKKRSAETDSVNVLDMITMSEALYNGMDMEYTTLQCTDISNDICMLN